MDGSIGGGGFVVMVEKLDLTVFDENKVHSVEQVFDYFDAVDHMKKYKYRDKRKHKLVLKQLR